MPVLKKNNKYYARVNYKDSEGKYKSKQSKYVDTKREAIELETKLRASLNKLPVSNKLTIVQAHYEFCEYKRKAKVNERTIHNYENYFNMFGKAQNLLIQTLTNDDYLELKDSLSISYSDTTIKYTLKYFLSIINFACKKHKIIREPLDTYEKTKKQPKKELNFYTFEEYEKFYSHLKTLKYKLIFDLLFFNGLRISELRGLTFDDVSDGKISINKQYIRSSGITEELKTQHSYRTLPINERVQNDIEAYKEYLQNNYYGFKTSWYLSGDINPTNHSAIREINETTSKKSNLKTIRIHDFRHSCASYYIHLGYPINLVAELLGDNITTIYNTYYHLYHTDLKKMVVNSWLNRG